MPPLSDQSTRKLPLWFLTITAVMVAGRIYLDFAPPAAGGFSDGGGAVSWKQAAGLNSDAGRPLFLFLDDDSVATARDGERLFGDADIAALINSRFTPRHIDTTDVVALGLMGKEMLQLRRRSAIIVFGLDGKPVSRVETFIPRRSLLQLLRQSLVPPRQ
jgi:hypothetical protein